MGFRFRKSINLGKHFKINLSKSGVGFSAGIKGFRITRTANGKIRKTVSIPGTGISYVDESKGLGIVDDLLGKSEEKKTNTKKKIEVNTQQEIKKAVEQPKNNEDKPVFTLKTNYVEKD